MTRSLVIARWGRAWLWTLLLILATLGTYAASPQRMLMLFREDSHVPATRITDQALRQKLRTPAPPQLSCTPSITNPIVSPTEDMVDVRRKLDREERQGMPGCAELITG